MKILRVNPVPCTGCLNCQVACAQQRAGDQDPRASAIRIELDPFGGLHRHVVCRQCAEAVCAEVCPEEAIRRNPETGAWEVDRSLCRRCGACVRVCLFGAAFWWDMERGPVKCDLCGGAPRCVEACAFGVLSYLEPEDPRARLREMPPEEQSPDLGKGPPEEA